MLSCFSHVRLFATPWMDCSPPDFSVCGNLQARVLEWVAMSSSRASCASPALAGRFFTTIATWEVQKCIAAAAKSLQLCPTLCDPIDSSPPGSPVPGILQARPLEWVAISFSSAQKWKVKVKSLSCVRLFVIKASAHQRKLLARWKDSLQNWRK